MQSLQWSGLTESHFVESDIKQIAYVIAQHIWWDREGWLRA